MLGPAPTFFQPGQDCLDRKGALSDHHSAKDRGFASVQMEIYKIINIANDQAVIASKTTTFHNGMSIAPL
jgi:hypothetical protein